MDAAKLDKALADAARLRQRSASKQELERALDSVLLWAAAMKGTVMPEMTKLVSLLEQRQHELKQENDTLFLTLRTAVLSAKQDPAEAIVYLDRIAPTILKEAVLN